MQRRYVAKATFCVMDEWLDVLTRTALFSGIEADDISRLLLRIHAKVLRYRENELIVEEGSPSSDFGILLSGRGRSFRLDTMGRLTTITLLRPGSEIGVLLAASAGRRSPVSVEAQEELSVLSIPFKSLVGCIHDRLIGNFIRIIAEKGLVLHERLACLLQPTAREKILSYLSTVSCGNCGRSFSIPLDRHAMSEYLGMDRSALSRELSRMKADGLIDFHKNRFKLL